MTKTTRRRFLAVPAAAAAAVAVPALASAEAQAPATARPTLYEAGETTVSASMRPPPASAAR